MLNILTVSFLLCVLSFALNSNSISILLSLEILSLFIIVVVMILGLDMFFSLMLICIGACEAALGLSALIGMVRVSALSV